MADSDGVVVFMSRSLSYSVIFISVFMKVPQILALYRAGSSRGISVRAYWLEIVCYEIGVAYGFFYDYHISTYLESVLLAIQSYVIIILAVQYSSDWTIENGVWLVANGAFISAIVTKAIPPYILSLLLAATIPLVIVSQGTRIVTLYRIKKQGDVSLATFALAAYGCAARLFTVAVEVKDMQIFFTFLLCLILNMIIVIQCIIYGRSHESDKKKT